MEYSPKIAFPTFGSFCKEILNWRVLVILPLASLGFVLILLMGSLLRVFTRGEGVSALVPQLYYEAAMVFVGCLLLFIVSAFLTRIILWHQRFTLSEGRIIDHFPTEKVFSIRQINKIVLKSPKIAHVLLKRNEDALFTVSYWYGNSEQDWRSFLDELAKWDPEIENKLFVSPSKWKPQLEVKSDIDSSYLQVVDSHKT